MASSDFNRYLVSKNITNLNDVGVLTGPSLSQTTETNSNVKNSIYGYVFGLPQNGASILQTEIETKWASGAFGTEKLLETVEGSWLVLSEKNISHLVMAQC